MEGVKIVRLQTIGGNAILVISDKWLYAQEGRETVILIKEPILQKKVLKDRLMADVAELMEVLGLGEES